MRTDSQTGPVIEPPCHDTLEPGAACSTQPVGALAPDTWTFRSVSVLPGLT